MKYLGLIVVCFLLHFESSAQGKLTSNDSAAKVVQVSKETEDASTKLKAALIKNLVQDKLIACENELVELDFTHNKVLLNKKEMTADHAEKYVFMLKGFGFRAGDRYLIHLQSNMMSLKAYSREGKLLQEILVEEGSWTSAL